MRWKIFRHTDGALRVSIVVVVFVFVGFALGVIAGSGAFSLGAGMYCRRKTISGRNDGGTLRKVNNLENKPWNPIQL